MKILINTARIIVGVLFIFSGLIKGNDPLGLSYKMQEFFEVWGWTLFNDFALPIAIAMIAFEIVAGVAVLLGWQMKLFSWLLLLLIVFFSFLTGYALFSGRIKECGCFGDCIPLQAGQSFVKDLILLVLIVFIFFTHRRIKPFFGATGNIATLFFAAVFSFALQWYVLAHLPLVDCLAYKTGSHMLEKMKIPPGSVPDSTVISFVYQKDGKETEFTADQFPADFNDSLYKFVRRYDKLIRKGNAEPAIKDFSLTDSAGQDITQNLLNQDGHKILLFIKDEVNKGEWTKMLELVMHAAAEKRIHGYLVTNMPLSSLYNSQEAVLRNFAALRCDATAIKTAARANPTLYLLEKDRIVAKWGYADFEDAAKKILALGK